MTLKCIVMVVAFILLIVVAWWALARRTSYKLLEPGGPLPEENNALWEPEVQDRGKRIRGGCAVWALVIGLLFGAAYLVEDVRIVDALRPSATPTVTQTATVTLTPTITATPIVITPTKKISSGGALGLPTKIPTGVPNTPTQKVIYVNQTVIVTKIITQTPYPTNTPWPTHTPYYTQTPWILIVTNPPQVTVLVVTATYTSTETPTETPTGTPTETPTTQP